MNNSWSQGYSKTTRKYKSTESMPRKVFQILKVEKLVSFLATGRKLLLELEKNHNNTNNNTTNVPLRQTTCAHTQAHTHMYTPLNLQLSPRETHI